MRAEHAPEAWSRPTRGQRSVSVHVVVASQGSHAALEVGGLTVHSFICRYTERAVLSPGAHLSRAWLRSHSQSKHSLSIKHCPFSASYALSHSTPSNITDVGMWLVKSYLTEASFYAVLSLIPICSHLCAREYSLPVATSAALCARPTRLSSML